MKPQAPEAANDAAKPQTRENANLQPGSPPRPATEPPESQGSSRNAKTATDPATGVPDKG